jgi:tetratricopeptide (TPR) repeat protein
MKKIKFIISITITFLLICPSSFSANSNYFSEAKVLFDKEQFDKSKLLFEKDIVFNPKSEQSYLYLAKIFNKNENELQQEVNLNSVLLLNPQNEEAIYMMALIKINQADYNESKKLIKKFTLACMTFCNKKSELKNKLGKLIPENE